MAPFVFLISVDWVILSSVKYTLLSWHDSFVGKKRISLVKKKKKTRCLVDFVVGGILLSVTVFFFCVLFSKAFL